MSKVSPIIRRKEEMLSLHNDIDAAIRITVDKAIKLGELCVEQKKDVGHGNWETWLVDNMPFSKATARNYMMVYRNRELAKTLTISVLTDLYSQLRAFKRKRKQEEITADESDGEDDDADTDDDRGSGGSGGGSDGGDGDSGGGGSGGGGGGGGGDGDDVDDDDDLPDPVFPLELEFATEDDLKEFQNTARRLGENVFHVDSLGTAVLIAVRYALKNMKGGNDEV
jgi:hypothetical protein